MSRIAETFANLRRDRRPGLVTYTTAGDHTYSKDVPASALNTDAVTVDFALDKFLPPGTVDQRELGIVVTSIGFESK